MRRSVTFKRRSEGHAALAALVDIVFRRLELVLHEFEKCGRGEIGDREDRFEDRLQPLVGAAALRLVDEQELIVRSLLNFDQVWHFRDFADVTEELAGPLTSGECLRHFRSS